MKKEYWRLITMESKDLNKVRTKDLFYFDSGDYKTDVKLAREYRRGKRIVYVSKRKYNTFGEVIKPNPCKV